MPTGIILDPNFDDPTFAHWPMVSVGEHAPRRNLESLTTGASPLVVHTPNSSMRLHTSNHTRWNAFVYQQVDVVPGQLYEFVIHSLAWANDNPDINNNNHNGNIYAECWAGVDYQGKYNGESALPWDVVEIAKVARSNRTSGHLGSIDRFLPLRVLFVAWANRCTVFAGFVLGEDWLTELGMGFVDTATLTAIPLPINAPPTPTPTPTPVPTPGEVYELVIPVMFRKV